MKHTLIHYLVPLLSPLAIAGCADTISTGQTDQDLVSANGVSLNGVSLNGVSLNGVSLNGVSLNGVSLNGVSLNGVSLNGVSLNGVSLNGVSLNGVSLNGVSLNGTTWTGSLSDGTTIPLRIDSFEQGTGANSDLSFYGVSYYASDTWSPICGVDANNTPIEAIAVPGVWNTDSGVVGGGAYSNDGTQFTWSCRGKTIGKCVEMGYKNWLGYSEQLNSCVRMLRGDYCGNGHAYTANGQTVNLYDNLGIQTDTESWGAEAEWTSAGAGCILDTAHTRYTHVGNPTPTCVTDGTLPIGGTCGASFANGATLIDELPAF
jgi:ADYC domain/Pentapeptide repeats (8 copies)